jgi:hypothetical protein
MLPPDSRPRAAPSRNDGVTTLCPICQRAFVPRGRQQVCSAACRQALWRRRHPSVPAGPALLPARSARSVTIYECAACGTRYLGEQRCPECHQFCRRVGLGGRCPHCDEPVAVADLLGPALTEGGERSLHH